MLRIIIYFLCEVFALVLTQQSCTDIQSCLYPLICKRVNFTGGPDRGGPFYDHVISNVPIVTDLDNTCSSGLMLTPSTLLQLKVLVFKDGSKQTDRIIYSKIPGFPGAYRGERLTSSPSCSSCVFNDYFLGSLDGPCEGVFAFYRCYFEGDCVAKNNGPDRLVGYSIDEELSDYCYAKLIEFVDQFGLEGPGYVRLPHNKSTRCIDLTKLAAVNIGHT